MELSIPVGMSRAFVSRVKHNLGEVESSSELAHNY